jgi:hypothetical protein
MKYLDLMLGLSSVDTLRKIRQADWNKHILRRM